jgi:Flp pilus assembly pilin Flp
MTAALRIYVRVTSAFDADRGASAVEYALMVALIAALIIISVTLVGNRLSDRLGGQWMP